MVVSIAENRLKEPVLVSAGWFLALTLIVMFAIAASGAEPLSIGSRGELLDGDFPLVKKKNLTPVLHPPVHRALYLDHDKPLIS